MFKIDLHTHSTASPDGGISAEQYKKALHSGAIDFVAITDHNRIDFALQLQKQLGEKIIVGEEIMTNEGEIIGLYLEEAIPAGLSVADTVARIRGQGGLVYIPHPFETVRKGLHPQTLEQLDQQIDIIEVCNGRAFLQNRSQQAVVWARINGVAPCASSDAHGARGLGATYSKLSAAPTRESLVPLLTQATLMTKRPNLRSLLYPKYYRLRKKLKGQS